MTIKKLLWLLISLLMIPQIAFLVILNYESLKVSHLAKEQTTEIGRQTFVALVDSSNELA